MLAFVKDEPGAKIVRSALPLSVISSVNIAECITKLVDKGPGVNVAVEQIDLLQLDVRMFTDADAIVAGRLRETTREFGLSLGDRACLALALRLSAPVLTTDSQWSKLDIGVEVRLIR